MQTRKQNKRRLGGKYEQAAGRYLESLGYEILAFNYRCKLGEIDLIAKDGAYLVFCEVKYRSGPGTGDPAEAVDSRKQRRISNGALWYLMEHGLNDVPCRFDVISICDGRIRHIPNAFMYTGE